MQEYNNLPLRFSRQLSLDQMNDAVDYVNAVVEGKRNGGGSSAGEAFILSFVPSSLPVTSFAEPRESAQPADCRA